ncbi:hypothetical protein D8B26_002529 [Coccidioides posadasii str. Silveira]|uniref:Uncharacterized protein n=1 Tax=Coccidioides posadasii (strain RMSCC 757 / Silveira) TaxID=443226 RepID=E9DIM8_COCPS|nr:conserved hypothetical protein [Coccidioides posadasii str. Silveira]QVM07835.1 hypothetical protein D8B26_002529 [Coccidioides posadasii str. Silveira]
MIRCPRATAADDESSGLARILQPLTVVSWGPAAIHHLGVPIVVATVMISVRDEDYQTAIQKLKDAGFIPCVPTRKPAPEILASFQDPSRVIEEMNAGFKRVDCSSTTFEYPEHHPRAGLWICLFPNSFTHLLCCGTTPTKKYDIYDNLFYPLEELLVESFVKAAIDEENEFKWSNWSESLRAWLSMMTGYLEVNNDVLDNCTDKRAVEWYSTNFGRIREAKFGPWDRRVSKRLGSGKEMSVDMRGHPVW